MDTSLIFFILATILLMILVGWSVWAARREKSRVFSNTFSTRTVGKPLDQVVNEEPMSFNPQAIQTENLSQGEHLDYQMVENSVQIQQEVEESLQGIKISLPNQPVEEVQPNTPPQYQAQTNIFQEPVLQQSEQSTQIIEPALQAPIEKGFPNNMVTLYIVAPENQHFSGPAIAHHLDVLGFRFGEYNIFHRHQHIDNTAGEVLFSIANMMQPGTFDLAKIEQFSTAGLVMFMYLPTVGNDLVNLKIMMRTAENIAQSLGGFVLDDQQRLFDEHIRQSYLARLQ